MALSSANTQAAIEIIDDATQIRDQLRLLIVNLADERVVGGLATAPPDTCRQGREGLALTVPELAPQPLDAAHGGRLPAQVARGVVEAKTFPATDRAAQIHVAAAPAARRANEPHTLDAERRVPGQLDERSVDRDAVAFPANLERMARARATQAIVESLASEWAESPPFYLFVRYRQKSLNGAALNCVYLVVCWIDRWPSQSEDGVPHQLRKRQSKAGHAHSRCADGAEAQGLVPSLLRCSGGVLITTFR
jgi:hypothetical protein